MGRGVWMQCELKVAEGSAEPWLIVRHRRGWFRLPLLAGCDELVEGVRGGWTSTKKVKARRGEVRVTLTYLRDLEAARAERDALLAVRELEPESAGF